MIYIYAFLCLFLVFRAEAVSYWIDSSCTGKVDEATFDEVRLMATEGTSRLQHADDEIMAAAFRQIFKVDTRDVVAFTKANTAFSIISGFASTADFKSSDVRIYCDNDARWELVPNLAKKNKNSKREPDDQEWWDPVNFIYRRMGNYGCGNDGTIAETFKYKNPGKADQGLKDGQNPGREVITICDVAFKTSDRLLSSIPATKDLTTHETEGGTGMEGYDDFISVTLFHEMCHLTKVIGIPGSNHEAIGWAEVMETDAKDVVDEADAYAFLGITAILNARNFRLSADAKKATEGDLEWIIPPVAPAPAPARMRAMRFFA